MVIEREGQQLTVSIREGRALTVDEQSPAVSALRTAARDPHATTTPPPETTPTPTGTPTRTPIVDPPAAPTVTPVTSGRAAPMRVTRPGLAEAEAPTATFVERHATEHPMLADAVARVTGPQAEVIRLRALGAAERSPMIRAFIEENGAAGAKLVGEVGEASFLRAFGGDYGISFRAQDVLRVPGRQAELARLARTNPEAVRTMLDRWSSHGDMMGRIAEAQGFEAAMRYGQIAAANPQGMGYMLAERNGRANVMSALASNPEGLAARATYYESRVFMRTTDGHYLLRGDVRPPAPVPERAALEALAQRAGVDPAVLDNPTAHPREMARLMAQMRTEMRPAERTALDRELAGRRLVDQEHYDEAVAAGVADPENRYGANTYAAWSRANTLMMEAARSGRPLTVDLLMRAHALAAEPILAEPQRGMLRNASTQPVRQGGEGPLGLQRVTEEQLAILRGNPDLRVSDLGAAEDGFHRVMVEYTPGERVAARMQEIVDRVNTRLAAGEDPVVVAADAQREMVSVHPFMDGNGRMSRLLMDYVLERGGVAPSVVRDPNLDTAVTADAWRGEVRAGLERPWQSTLDAWARSTAPARGPAGTFQSQRAVEEDAFVRDYLAGGPGRTEADGRALFELAGGRRADVLPGFSRAEDIAPTIDRAVARVAETGEPAVAVRASIRNLGGLNKALDTQGANAVMAEFAGIVREELARTGANVLAFRSGGDLTFVITGREVPQATIDAALLRAQSRIAQRSQALGLSNLEHPKHVGDPAWRGVGISTASARIGPHDTAVAVTDALDVGVLRYNLALGQEPASTVRPEGTPSAGRPASVPAGAPTPVPPRRAADAPHFLSESALREARVMEFARAHDISRTEALRLLDAAGGNAPDPVTGFGIASEQVPTVERAIAWARDTGERAYYVEIDVRNLGGLNAAVGRTAADGDVAVLAQILREELGAVGADVAFVRQGGDEFSAVVVGPGVEQATIDARLAAAQARYDQYIAARGLSEIPHLKYPDDPARRGVGFTFATQEARGGDSAAAVIKSAAGRVEELKARSTGGAH